MEFNPIQTGGVWSTRSTKNTFKNQEIEKNSKKQLQNIHQLSEKVRHDRFVFFDLFHTIQVLMYMNCSINAAHMQANINTTTTTNICLLTVPDRHL